MSHITPMHVALILDGNRRWAKAHHLPALEGHRRGVESFRHVARRAFDRGVRYLSAYVFSTENWSRSETEVSYLMSMVQKVLEMYVDEFHERGIRVVVLGRRDGLRAKVVRAIEQAEHLTRNNTNGTLALCFNYGGKQELVDAMRQIAASGAKPEDIDQAMLDRALYAPEVPSVDLMVRTSGEHRTSGFMLSRSDYAELYFSDKNWPDFTPDDLDDALSDFERRQRRFGQ